MSAEKDEVVENPDPHFEPLVKLAPVDTITMEENEDELFKMRAKLFRFDVSADPPEWKERGTGEVKFMQHKLSGSVRLLMRRDKTHKVCANHYLTKDIKLLPSAGSDRAWVYTVQADFADEEAKVEQLAIRFKNAENALKFKAEFERCQDVHTDKNTDLTTQIEKLSVNDNEQKEDESKDEKNVQEEGGKGDTQTGGGTSESQGTQTSSAPSKDEGGGEEEKPTVDNN